MTKELRLAIGALYDTFARYQGLSTLEGSPLYDDLGTWKQELRSKSLRDLSPSDLSLFASKVITTWGDENDYRCYLPRIMELTAEYNTPYDIWTLYSRLEQANWKNWKNEEQKSINDYTRELWSSMLSDNCEEAISNFKEYFHAIAKFYPVFSDILKIWEANKTDRSIYHLSCYVLEERSNLFDKNYIDSMERNSTNIHEFMEWLTSDTLIEKIREVFFRVDEQEFAERISWLEQILMQEKRSRA